MSTARPPVAQPGGTAEPAAPPVPGLPVDADGPVFAEPWQAQAFAMAVALHERGVFSWPQWAQALAGRIAAAQQAGDPDTGDTYYLHWLATLELMVAQHGLADPELVQQYRDGWQRAAERTPHGRPIELLPADLAAENPPPHPG
jgi:nitrile hydratase accessory protein